MTIPPSSRPRVPESRLRDVLRHDFGASGELEPLPSERDQNLRVRPRGASGWLLKVSNAHDDPAALEMQDAILQRLAGAGTGYAFPSPAADPVTIEHDDLTYTCRLLRWVPGRPLARCRPRPPGLWREVGDLMGAVASALLDLEHPAADRRLQWDLMRTIEICGERIGAVGDRTARALLERWLERIEPTLAAAARMRRGVIQNDANDHNLLCGPVVDHGDGWRRSVVGLVDVGDAIASPVVVECAVAIAYAMLGRVDPVGAATAVAEGFHGRLPLGEPEVDALHDLAVARLALSVCNSAVQAAAEKDVDYLSVSERDAWRALAQLDAVPAELSRYRLRAACGLEPCPAAPAVREWLVAHREQLAPVVAPEPTGVHVFDLGVGSCEMGGGAPGTFETDAVTRRLFGILRERGATLGIGRYDEARCWYGGELFASPGDDGGRRRTVHIGVDLFAEPGTPLHAPLAGRIAAARWNRGRLDYGPTLVLEHEPTPGVRFWTLWGHLDPACLESARPGDAVEAGDEIARVGAPPENGDWAPHLHLQIICDALGHDGDFPGVVDPEQREVWIGICPDPDLLLRLPAATSTGVGEEPDAEAILRRREGVLAPSLSLSYRRPLHIVRGFRQYLYAADGQAFLDAVNNVPHVGHSHPRVVAAAAAQNEILNTNTRYLHAGLVRYAERLAGLFPGPLEVVFLVCSGSEANELAVRLARAHTGERGMVALEGGYHGNTSTLIDLSHYKHSGPGGSGAPDWVRIASLPDPYRGRHRDAGDPARAHADDVGRAARALAGSSAGLAGFLAEPLIGCGGQIVPPAGYLAAAFERVRAAGGVCIADEVQIGLGRVGTHTWAFEQQGAVPDVVTLGKPLGNGYPLAAVVTTRAIAESFANGMEYFNTFGGNPVACEVGLAVLDVLEDEGLARNAEVVGSRLLDGLHAIVDRRPIAGDARGVGLYLGLELVRDPETREPADVEAAHVVNRMRERGILTSTDGPYHNVIKIKPPLCFGLDDADRLLETLDTVLDEDLPGPSER